MLGTPRSSRADSRGTCEVRGEGVSGVSREEQEQEAHFDAWQEAYERHYDDQWSARMRRRFYMEPALRGFDLAGRQALEAMCGSGQSTGFLLERGALVTGLDISAAMMESFQRRWPACRAVTASVLDTGLPGASFDFVLVVGGLHHVHPYVKDAVREIGRLLKPGGVLAFVEPHAGSLPDLARRAWYKRDPLFLANEASIDVRKLVRDFAADFELLHEEHHGGPGYLLVINSLILRIPHALKRWYAPPMILVDRLLDPFLGRRLGCFVVVQLRRR
jgi:SAM-dependent methyltransferase